MVKLHYVYNIMEKRNRSLPVTLQVIKVFIGRLCLLNIQTQDIGNLGTLSPVFFALLKAAITASSFVNRGMTINN